MKAITDNLPEKMTAHAVRHLRACNECGGIGDGRKMVQDEWGHSHTRCYVRQHGMTAVLQLPHSEQAKFRVCDLTIKQMRKLIDAMAVYKPA